MGSTLERVIEDQQREIDRLKKLEQSNTEAWIKENKRKDDFMDAFWVFWADPSDNRYVVHMREILIKQGWCLRCEQQGYMCTCHED